MLLSYKNYAPNPFYFFQKPQCLLYMSRESSKELSRTRCLVEQTFFTIGAIKRNKGLIEKCSYRAKGLVSKQKTMHDSVHWQLRLCICLCLWISAYYGGERDSRRRRINDCTQLI